MNRDTSEEPNGAGQTANGKQSPWKARIARFKPLMKWFVVLVVLVFLGLTLRRAYQDLEVHREKLDFAKVHWGWILGGILLYAAGMIPAGLAWLQTLKAFQQRIPFWYGLYVYFLGHLGKYVPGKAMVIVLRAGKLHPLGVEIKPTIVSVFVETLTSVCTGAVLGGAFLLMQSPRPPGWMLLGAALGIPCCAAMLLPHTFRAILAVLAKSKVGRMPRSVSNAFTGRLMVRVCLWMCLGWLLHGTAGWLVLGGMQSCGLQSEGSLWTFSAWSACVAAVSLGAVVGFASMLPSGAIVRELVITWLLSQIVSQPIALFAAVAFRICNLVAEFLMIGILMQAKTIEKRRQETDSATTDNAGA
jgi:uncharacterized membrane protein YbhN (UPF0104 family)